VSRTLLFLARLPLQLADSLVPQRASSGSTSPCSPSPLCLPAAGLLFDLGPAIRFSRPHFRRGCREQQEDRIRQPQIAAPADQQSDRAHPSPAHRGSRSDRRLPKARCTRRLPNSPFIRKCCSYSPFLLYVAQNVADLICIPTALRMRPVAHYGSLSITTGVKHAARGPQNV
jgi:hypothetical protein